MARDSNRGSALGGRGRAPRGAAGSAPAGEGAQPTDEELLSRYRDTGLAADFNELVRRYERELYRFLARYLGDAVLAEDVFQATFLQVHLKRGLYEDGRPVRPWLYAIATHQAIDALRRAGRATALSLDRPVGTGRSDPSDLVDLLVGDDPSPLAALEEEERRHWVRDSLARLPEPHRETLILAYFQDLEYREIAQILGIPVGTVKSRIHTAIASLRRIAQEAERGRG
ncbi:MAG: RNA polymerase sigma factor [Isosphaeraceae bacterium]|nr:RNA polymerase sigma factor [Isosphaeraceae bacterium]